MQRRNFRILTRLLILAAGSIISLAFAQDSRQRYILTLEDPPVASRFRSREAMATAEAGQYRQQIAAKQNTLRQQLAERRFQVIGSVSTVLNAVFVAATPDRVAELRALPGVVGVARARHFHRSLNRATQLVNATVAWTAPINGLSNTNAGAGIKIAILDTGIDQTNPAFQDPSLPTPATPLCDPTHPAGTCSQSRFTTNKVIVARSYVGLLAAGSDPSQPQLDSRPDDISPRDHEGHGTAVASCAAGVAGTVTPSVAAGGSGTIAIGGVAPKALLGNYRVYGSPEVNDTTSEDVILLALEDAVADEMDVISFSSGAPAESGALDKGATCGNPAGEYCDAIAQAFETTAEAGRIITVSAGNDGYPGTIESPGDAPSVITVGATTSSHYFTPTASAAGADAPSTLKNVAAILSAGIVNDNLYTGLPGAVTGPLVDVATLGDPGTACNALPPYSLAGDIALIEMGTCTADTKVFNAVNAFAIGVLLYSNTGPVTGTPYVDVGTAVDYLQVVMIGQSDGQNMKSYIDANPNQQVTLDTDGAEQDDTADASQFATFSSMGPNVGPLLVKPELVAPGESPQDVFTNNSTPYYYGGVYMAAETYDPLGELYSSTGFGAFDGTSFSTPIAAGAAALVLQAHPSVTGSARLALVRSALINNTWQPQAITTDDLAQGDGVDTFEIGSGLLNVGAAVSSTITVSPATMSFGTLSSTTLPPAQQFTITNNGASPVSLSVGVSPNLTWDFPSSMILTASSSSVSLAAGASQTVTITPSGTVPGVSSNGYAIGSGPGDYTGSVTIQGPGVSLIVPYVYVVGDGIYAQYPTMLPFGGDSFDGTVGQDIPPTFGEPLFELVDDLGLPIAGASVTWSVSTTTSTLPTIVSADSVTNQYGTAGINQVTLGSQPGTYYFTAIASYEGYELATYTFSGNARVSPALRASDPVENAASFDTTVAPGSYVALFGSGLSDPGGTAISNTLRLPMAIDYVNVSFDVPSANPPISVPGHLMYVSPTQVNVQVPWELQNALQAGLTSAFVKVTIDYSPGNVVSVPIQAFAPGFFGAAGTVAALDNDTGAVINQSNPAVRGKYVQLYVNGLGPVTNQPASGDPALGYPDLSTTTNTVTVKIGGQSVTPSFSGLAPGFAGLYQVNFQVPTSLPPGPINQPIAISVGGVTSQASAMWVQ
ncbi:MAG: S8 family serine peptidase [Bryobacteraceae bacterium]